MEFIKYFASVQNLNKGDFIDEQWEVTRVQVLDSMVRVFSKRHEYIRVVDIEQDLTIEVTKYVYPVCSLGHDMRG
jgi:hypothetical protein